MSPAIRHIVLWAGLLTLLSGGPAMAQDSFAEASRAAVPQAPPEQSTPQMPQASPQPARQPAADAFGQPPGFGQPASGAGPNLDALMQLERQDYGVPPTSELHAGEMHAPTPASIPGGQVITTKGLVELLQGGQVPVPHFGRARRSGDDSERAVRRACGAIRFFQRPDATAVRPISRAGDGRQQGTPDRSLLPIDAMLDVVQRFAAGDRTRLYERALVSRRHRGVETGRAAGASSAALSGSRCPLRARYCAAGADPSR